MPLAQSGVATRVPQRAIEPGSAIVAVRLPTDAKTVPRNYPPIGPTESATVTTAATPCGVISPRIYLATATAFGEIIRITLDGASTDPTVGLPGEP